MDRTSRTSDGADSEIKSTSDAKRADDSGGIPVYTNTSNPVPITGTNLVATQENLRKPNCNIESQVITCTMTIEEGGSLYSAGRVKEGLSVVWKLNNRDVSAEAPSRVALIHSLAERQNVLQIDVILVSESSGQSVTQSSTVVAMNMAFAYVGNALQQFTVPQSCSTLTVKAWGAGGGASTAATMQTVGGGGGYATAAFNLTNDETVKPGVTLNVLVGQGGLKASAASTYGAGAGGGLEGVDNLPRGGSGGGRSEVFIQSSRLVVAGGGGGAGYLDNPGGAGGGEHGETPLTFYPSSATPGSGGTQIAAGAGGTGSNLGLDGYLSSGGRGGNSAPSNDSAGGGGGGGFFGGGGGGGGGLNFAGAGGGGGSSFPVAGSVSGSGRIPANRQDNAYVMGVGAGGMPNENGGNGLVVVSCK